MFCGFDITMTVSIIRNGKHSPLVASADRAGATAETMCPHKMWAPSEYHVFT